MTIKTKIAEALFPFLSAFHDVSGLALRAVTMGRSDGLLTHIALDFESKSLMVRADGEDDTVEICSIDSPRSERLQENDASNVYPWENLIGQELGWGWVTVNQQGYLDGIVLSFGGVTPQFLITVAASELKVSEISIPI